MSRAAVVQRPIDVAALQAEVTTPATGAVSMFVGLVRETNAGRAVAGIEYSAYSGMALREMESILREAEAQFSGIAVAVEHRVGALGIGEASVVVAAAHARRAPAIDACRFVIEELKRRVPIWKREHYADGAREWVHAGTGVAAPEQVTS